MRRGKGRYRIPFIIDVGIGQCRVASHARVVRGLRRRARLRRGRRDGRFARMRSPPRSRPRPGLLSRVLGGAPSRVIVRRQSPRYRRGYHFEPHPARLAPTHR